MSKKDKNTPFTVTVKNNNPKGTFDVIGRRIITGKELIGLGYKPDRWFKEALLHINANNLRGKEMEEYLKSVCPPPAIEPFSEPLDYFLNIRAEHK